MDDNGSEWVHLMGGAINLSSSPAAAAA